MQKIAQLIQQPLLALLRGQQPFFDQHVGQLFQKRLVFRLDPAQIVAGEVGAFVAQRRKRKQAEGHKQAEQSFFHGFASRMNMMISDTFRSSPEAGRLMTSPS